MTQDLLDAAPVDPVSLNPRHTKQIELSRVGG